MPANESHNTLPSDLQNDHEAKQGRNDLGRNFAAAGGQDGSRTPTEPESTSAADSNASSALAPSSAPGSSIPHSSQSVEIPGRSQRYDRRSEELHIPFSRISIEQQSSEDPARPTSYLSTQGVGSSVAMGINVQQSTPQANQLPAFAGSFLPGVFVQQSTPQANQLPAFSGSFLPGVLQPGRQSSPTIDTDPFSIPALIQSSKQPQSAYSAQSSTGSQAHSSSRSSPAGMHQQEFVSCTNTPESSKYTSTTTHKCSSPAPQGDSTHSPLDQEISDGPSSTDPYSVDEPLSVPSNSNYLAPWDVYAFAWCKWPVQQDVSNYGGGKMAIGSYIEEGHNFIQILDTHAKQEMSLDRDVPQYSLEYTKIAEAQHPYPVTKILWEPASTQKESTNMLATTSDHLRLWSLFSQSSDNGGNSITSPSNNAQLAPQDLMPLAVLSSSKSDKHIAPLTSFDWNKVSSSLIITSSFDTTCTLWDISTLTVKERLIAHDKEVFDVQFCANSADVFLSCGADGSVRMFDIRSLEHSIIVYEPSENAPPLLRLAASPHDTHIFATFSQDENDILVLDVRRPSQTLLKLRGHKEAINCVEWSHLQRGTLASGSDDFLVLIWDLLNQENAPSASSSEDFQIPTSCWQCDHEVNNISWAPQSALTSQGNDWVGVTGGKGIWGVFL